jgi:SAM-dependent methyltransferase
MMEPMDQRELWNDRYREKGSVWGAAPNEFVVTHLAGLGPCRVLDLGTGQGRNAIWLASQGHAVTAIDISDVAVAQAKAIAEEAGVDVDFMAADLEHWQPSPETYDLVLLAYIQVAEPTRKLIHGKVDLALAPAGMVFVIAHHLANLDGGIGGPPSPERLYDEETIAADFPGYRIEENKRVIRHVDKEGMRGDAIDLLFRAVKPAE